MGGQENPRVAIVGAGTMGSGIALAALYAGFEVQLQDVSPDVLREAEDYLCTYLERKDQLEAIEQARFTQHIRDLDSADLYIEAVPEDLGLKREVFDAMEAAAPDQALLATNTSTLSVTAIAAEVERPGRVVGMHFFNPAAVLPLVEIVRAAGSDPEAVQRAVQTAEAMGKTPVVVEDSPGFIVNRVARPYYGEALRLLGEGGPSAAKIDALVRSAGFPMGPFQLMDLIGIDVNLDAARSVYEQMFHEPRFRPHPIQQRKVNQGALGRKTGHGFYRYAHDGSRQGGLELEAPEPAGSGGLWFLDGRWDRDVGDWLRKSGFPLVEDPREARAAVVLAGREVELGELLEKVDRELPRERPIFCQTNDSTWSELAGRLEHPSRLIGFDALFFGHAAAACLVGSPDFPEQLRAEAEEVVRAAGRAPVWIQERPGMVLPRIVCTLANEAAFAYDEGLAEAKTIDRAMRLGVNYPHGPLAWGSKLGWDRVEAVLDHLQREYREPRYRASPAVRRWARGVGNAPRPGAATDR
ncbi:MAG: 3-hydroxyacyl-CoA dehydrogenase NAD-binding domain-containing protein [Anaerolineales bacterium]|nr:3-hydroxyacyl-CoA dehydrogenase NAD-binding domain-containing protein [Anaerolineales bacterium]